MRREFTSKVKAQAFERSGGHCDECTAKLMPPNIHYDHRLPDALGGEPVLANCQVLCRACHTVKTSTLDVPAIAKANRNHRKHVGIKKPSTFPCSKTSPYRKKINGTVERRVASDTGMRGRE